MQIPYPIIKFKRISSKFGRRWFLWKKRKITDFHNGWDFSANEGTPVYANASGIAHIGWDPKGFGVFVMISGRTPQDNMFNIYYGHLKEGSIKVKNGASVVAGDLLAEVGNTGFSTAAHLHFEFRIFKNGKFTALDPAKVLIERRS